MSSASPVRPLKRLRDDIDDKIEALSKVINTMTGSKKTFLQAKLNNIKLKKQKLIALYFCRSHEPSKQSLVDEMEIMIAENDINIDIESIRTCKKFKRSENRYLERLFRDPSVRENGVYNFSPSDASTSYDTSSSEIPIGHTEKQALHICKQISSNTCTSAVPMCDKSTITDPIHILNAKEIISPADRNISPMEATTGTVEKNSSPLIESILIPEENMCLAPLKEITSPTEENKSLLKENLPQMGEDTVLHSDGSYIQSKWFDSSFEMDQFLKEKAQFSKTSQIESFQETSVSEIGEIEYKHKTFRHKSKRHKAEELPTSAAQIAEQISTTAPIVNMLSEKKTENATNVAVPEETVPLPEATMALPKTAAARKKLPESAILPEPTKTLPETTAIQNTTNTVTLPNSINMLLQNAMKTVASPKTATVAMPKDAVVLPEAAAPFPEANHSHRLIVNLFGTYKEIYSSKNVTNSEKSHSTQNQKGINNYGNNGKLLTSMTDLKMDSKCHKNSAKKIGKENYPNSAEIQSSTKIGKKSCKAQHMATNNTPKKSKSKYSSTKSQCQYAKSKNFPTKCQDLIAKSQDLCRKSQDLSVKNMDLSNKFQDTLAKCEALSTKYQDSFAKSQQSRGLSTISQNLPAKCQEQYAKSKDLPTKFQDSFAKSQQSRVLSTISQNLPAQSQEQYAKYKDLPTKYQDSFAKSQQSRVLSTISQNLPAKSKDLPTNFQDSFARSQVLSTNLQDIPGKSMDLSTKYGKSQDSSSKPNRSTNENHKTIRKSQNSSSRSKSNKEAIPYMSELLKDAMEKNGENLSTK